MTLIHTAYENVAVVPAEPLTDPSRTASTRSAAWSRTGNDERERGNRRAAPLRIDASRGDWTDIEARWLAGDLRGDDLEDLFVDEIIVSDIGAGTDGWEFGGSSYSVELR